MAKSKNKVVRLVITTLVGAIMGFLLGYTVIKWIPKSIPQNLMESGGTWWESPLKIAVALVALWAALAAHELGHLLTGLAQGFRFH